MKALSLISTYVQYHSVLSVLKYRAAAKAAHYHIFIAQVAHFFGIFWRWMHTFHESCHHREQMPFSNDDNHSFNKLSQFWPYSFQSPTLSVE